MATRPKLVIFDCDGVLVDSEPIAMRVLLASLEHEGLRLDAATGYERFLGRSLADTREILAADFGVRLSDAALDRMRQDLYAAFRAELAPTCGTSRGTGQAEDQRLASPPRASRSASASASRSPACCRTLTGRIFSATMVARGKPAPDLFLHAARTMGFAPADCIVVEDSPAGIRAARAGGMRVVAFVGGSHAGSPGYRDRIAALGPDWTITDMRDLLGSV